MSVLRYRAKNHPQQTRKRGPNPSVDDRTLPATAFAALDAEFHFTIDVAASHDNARLPRHYTIEESGLDASWAGERVYCNPPYSCIRPWVEKAWHAWEYEGAEAIVMLLPANRTEQRWWQDLVEPRRDVGPWGFRVRFLPGRIRFIAAGKLSVGPNERPPFGSCLLIWRSQRTTR